VHAVTGYEREELLPFVNSFPARSDYDRMRKWFELPTRQLPFTTRPWSLEVEDAVVDDDAVIRIRYATKAEGRSLSWRKDYSGRSCLFTSASTINNRSLFPCQEPPAAMATWQAVVEAPEQCAVVCTGDEDGKVVSRDDGMRAHYFFTSMVLPMSTFAVAVGRWQCVQLVTRELAVARRRKGETHEESSDVNNCSHDPYPCHVSRGDAGPLIPCRIFAPAELIRDHVDVEALSTYAEACLEAARELLGPHPFSKLDLFVPPRCFSGLGLASPNLVFLSQSLVLNGGDVSMLVRLSHEVSHAWFGLVIGAMDWTEEWLSEVSLNESWQARASK
jgi:aminopeptidase O